MDFKEYYTNQLGAGMPVFQGIRYQRGHGLGSMFRSFFRWARPIFQTHALPLIKDGAKSIGEEAIRQVANIANDTLNGKKIETSLTERAKEAVNTLANKAEDFIKQQKGGGRKRKRKNETSIETKQPALDENKIIKSLSSSKRKEISNAHTYNSVAKNPKIHLDNLDKPQGVYKRKANTLIPFSCVKKRKSDIFD